MNKALLVLINGHPGTGKTTLGRRLAKDLALPFLSKDDLKECLFDTLGVGDQAWSQKLGRASVELLFLVVERQLEAGASLVMDLDIGGALISVDTTDFEQVDYPALLTTVARQYSALRNS